MKLKVKETDIQKTICDYLALRNYFFWRSNTTPIFDPTRHSFRAMPKYAMKGVADILLLEDGIFYAIEVKSRTGKQSDKQKVFQGLVEKKGGIYILAKSLEEVSKHL